LLTAPIPYTYGDIFTIEFWFKTTSTIQQGLFFSGNTGSNTGRFQLEINTLGGLTLYAERINSNNQGISSAPGIISTDTWYHVAVVKQLTSVNIYLNGSNVATATSTVALVNDFANNLYIGLCRSGNALRYLVGYISNFRVVNGSAVYIENFTPPTEPLFVIQNTTLLACQSSTLIDNSYNQYPITRVGYALVDIDNPFGVSTSTSVSVDLFDDISTTDSVINQLRPSAKLVFDNIDIQSGIDLPVTIGITDGIINIISKIDLQIEISELQRSVELIPNISAITQEVTSFNTLINRNSFTLPNSVPTDLFLSNNISSDLTTFSTSITPVIVKRSSTDKTSPLKISTARTVQLNTQTVNYSYWV
jgi:hypothetical protein